MSWSQSVLGMKCPDTLNTIRNHNLSHCRSNDLTSHLHLEVFTRFVFLSPVFALSADLFRITPVKTVPVWNLARIGHIRSTSHTLTHDRKRNNTKNLSHFCKQNFPTCIHHILKAKTTKILVYHERFKECGRASGPGRRQTLFLHGFCLVAPMSMCTRTTFPLTE